jgi:electron transport complex protein RnfC
MGGAAFPTQVKLSPPEGTRIEYAVINAAECEPFLTVDQRLLLEETRKVISGLRLVMKATGAREGVIAVEANKTDAFSKLTGLLGKSDDLRAELLKVKYPQGGEKQMIYSLFRRRVPAGGLPAAVGCVVQNVHTAVAIAEAVEEGKPMIERVVTVTGPGLKNPGNFMVRLGTPFSVLIEAAGGLPPGPAQVISGGPMMGIAQSTLEAPVIKGTSGILILPEVPRARNQPCVRCGECVLVCPMGLLPSELGRAVEKGRLDLFRSGGGANCIECGSCAYVCQAGRDLVQLIQLGKAALRKEGHS